MKNALYFFLFHAIVHSQLLTVSGLLALPHWVMQAAGDGDGDGDNAAGESVECSVTVSHTTPDASRTTAAASSQSMAGAACSGTRSADASCCLCSV